MFSSLDYKVSTLQAVRILRSLLRADPSSRGALPLWCVNVYDLETSRMRRLWPVLGCCARQKEKRRPIYVTDSA